MISVRYVAFAQAAYYLVTGIWPLVSIRTFQWITGPKVDLWLVKTVGLLFASIGGTLALAGTRRTVSPDLGVLAVSSAISTAAIDVVYVRRKRILPIYLADAAVELLLAAGWVLGLRHALVRLPRESDTP